MMYDQMSTGLVHKLFYFWFIYCMQTFIILLVLQYDYMKPRCDVKGFSNFVKLTKGL